MSDLKKFTKGELARQFVKEVASGSFTKGSGGAASNAGRVVSSRTRTPEGVPNDVYKARQSTDSANP